MLLSRAIGVTAAGATLADLLFIELRDDATLEVVGVEGHAPELHAAKRRALQVEDGLSVPAAAIAAAGLGGARECQSVARIDIEVARRLPATQLPRGRYGEA